MECFSSCVSTLFWFYILATLLFLFNLTIFISIIFKCDKLVNKVEHVAAKRDRYLPQELVQTKWELKAIVMVVLKWGCKRYLSIVSVLPTVNGCLHVPGLEKQTGGPAQKISNALLWTETIAVIALSKSTSVILPLRTCELMVYHCLEPPLSATNVSFDWNCTSWRSALISAG